jgi:hypothetical protein
MQLTTDIADAVVTALNADTFSAEFTATRMFRPEFKPQALAAITVVVVPRNWSSTLVSRNSSEHSCAVDVAVMKKVDSESAAELDPLLALADEIAAALQPMRFDDLNANCTAVENVNPESVIVLEHLHENRVFTCVVRATFTVP